MIREKLKEFFECIEICIEEMIYHADPIVLNILGAITGALLVHFLIF